ncbi:TonB-dependent receptor [Campylobacter sp. LR264d]|uniref:TonB-dependent receptor n=1 Tax=unclassified Campylobacter TaxID=2593542 RepID=UPI0012390141|nr:MULTISPECIES: TonB-dependent receptor [unclassified Campylobacter]KAA6227098.1 TonB-dependent receptor [Campylobacter sp. LR196d]KAA6229534.1 TonB-dependent receptor [Campylobacter sp. LR264d]
MKNKIFLSLACYLGLFSNAFANENNKTSEYQLDSIIIKDSADYLNTFDTPLIEQSRSISVINSESILRNSTTNGIQGILEQAPGIMFVRSGSTNGQVSIRGMSTQVSRALITLDGVPVLGRNTLALNIFDSNSLDAVEIIRGPASALYGSDAMNGVINFISRRYRGDINKEFDMDFRLRALEYSSVNSGLASRFEAIGGGDGFDVLFGLNGRYTEDYRSPEGEIKNSNSKNYGFDWNVGYSYDDIRYYTQGRYSRAVDNDGGGQFAGAGSDFGFIRKRDPIYETYLKFGVEAENLSFAEKLDWYVYWRYYTTDLYTYNAGTGNYVNNKVYNNNYIGGRLAFTSILNAHTLRYGVETLNALSPTQGKQVNLNTNIAQTNGRKSWQNTISAFITDDYSMLDNLILQGAIRYDHVFTTIGKRSADTESSYSDEVKEKLKNLGTLDEGALTGSLGAVWFLSNIFSITGNISHNFKAPGASNYSSASRDTNGNEKWPNPNLKSETSQTYELGFRIHDEQNFFTINAYRTNYKDMLKTTSSASSSNYYYENIGKTYIQGVELEGNHKFYDFILAYNATHTYGQNRTENKPLDHIAPLYGRISLQYDYKNFGYLKVQERMVKGKTRIDESQERKSGSYAMSDIYAGLNLGAFSTNMKDMELTFGVENIFDRKGRNPVNIEDISYDFARTNPLLEPGTNFFVKYSYNY